MSDIIGPDGSRKAMEPEMAAKVNQQMMGKVLSGLAPDESGKPMLPIASPLIRSGETMNSVYRAWPNSLAKALVGLATGWKSDPEPELSPMEKAYEIASTAMFATSKFKGMYPTFEAYTGRMKELGIPLDLLGKQKAKGFYKEVPANEAEYLARAGGDWPSIKSAIDSIPRHKPGGLDFITDLRGKFPDMPKAEFDEMMLKLSREGKISLHHHDMPGSYKGEMIKDGDTYYHAFGVKPEWRDKF